MPPAELLDPALVTAAAGLAERSGRDGPRALLGIAGAPGAGKTTLAQALLLAVGELIGPDAVGWLPMDGFHLADVQLDRLGLRSVKGAPDTFDVDGYRAALRRAGRERARPVYAPGFERTLEQPIAGALVILPSARLVITEGNYLLLPDDGWPAVRRTLDEVWFVQIDDRMRVRRLIERHVAFGKTPAQAAEWVHRSDQANAALVAATADGADRQVLSDGRRFSFAAHDVVTDR